jgi:hypothetical protein
VKTDRRDAETLAQLYRLDFLPECYIPPPDIEMVRLIVRQRMDIGHKLALVKIFLYFSQVKSLVTMEEQLQSQFALIVPLPQRFSVLSPSVLCISESLASLHPLQVSVIDCLLESPSHLPPVGVVCA